MAHLERPAFFGLDKAWNSESRLPDKIRFEKGNPKKKGEVTPDNGDYGLEFTIGVTLREFNDMNKELQYENNEKWQAFRKCLTGSQLTQWDNMANTFYEEENKRKTDAFDEALNKWLDAICACKNARDCQYRHMADRF